MEDDIAAHDRTVKLQSTTFTVPRPDAEQQSFLEVSVAPRLHVVDPQSYQPNLQAHSLFDCLDVTVPVGGRVTLKLRIDSDDIGDDDPNLAEIIVSYLLDILRTVSLVNCYGCGVTRQNMSALSLAAVDCRTETHTTISDEEGDSSSCSPLPQTTFALTPESSSAPRHALIQALINRETPIAHLTELAIRLKWQTVLTRSPLKRPRKTSTAGSEESHAESHEVVGYGRFESQDPELSGALFETESATDLEGDELASPSLDSSLPASTCGQEEGEGRCLVRSKLKSGLQRQLWDAFCCLLRNQFVR